MDGNSDIEFTIVAVDDNSTDGTKQLLHEMKEKYDIYLLNGSGNLFYSGGMRMGMEYVLKKWSIDYDYLLMVNDDVSFMEHGIELLVQQSLEQNNAIVVGALKNDEGQLSYGAIKYIKGIRYKHIPVTEWRKEADTFNANCVLIPYEAFKTAGAIDKHYLHSLGDYDYGLTLKRAGYTIYNSKKYVGICNNDNPKLNTWNDTSLTRWQRIKKKEEIKGAPSKQWFYYLKKNFNCFVALKGVITPYIRILIKK